MSTVTTPANMPTKTKTLLSTLAGILGVDISLLDNQFKLVLQGVPSGAVYAALQPANGDTQIDKVLQPSSLTVSTSGAENANITSGTATLVASTIDVTVTGGVPAGSTVYATVTTPGGVTKLLAATVKDVNTITIQSPATAATAFKSLASTDGVDGVLTAGVNAAVALANVAGDVLAVTEKTPGGTAADHFSVVRVDNNSVKVQAQTSAGALQSANTSTVTVYNLGQLAHETSIVRWVVVRP